MSKKPGPLNLSNFIPNFSLNNMMNSPKAKNNKAKTHKSPPRSRYALPNKININMSNLHKTMNRLAKNTPAASQKEAHMMEMYLHRKLGPILSPRSRAKQVEAMLNRAPSPPKSKKTIENLFNSIAAVQLFKNKTGKGKKK